MSKVRKLLVAVPVAGALLTSWVTRSAAQLTVFDPANYQENLLSAARALEQINNQVRQLQNQVLMIQRMDLNLVRLGSTISPDLRTFRPTRFESPRSSLACSAVCRSVRTISGYSSAKSCVSEMSAHRSYNWGLETGTSSVA